MKKQLSILVGIALVIMLALPGISCATVPTPSLETVDEPESTSTPSPEPATNPGLTPAGTVAVYVTDAPARNTVTSIMVTISEVSIHRAVAEQEQQQQGEDDHVQEQEQQQVQQGEDEWLTIDIEANARSFDLFDVAGIEQLLGESEVTAGKYTQVRLTIESIEVALEDGVLQPATLPSGVLKFVHPFDVIDGEVTELLIDFDAEKSVTVTGAGQVLVKPVVKLVVQGGSSAGLPEEGEEETVEELEYEGTIEAIEGTVWTMTINGETETVDVSGAEITGEPVIGLEAEVKGTVVDDVLIASEAEIYETEEETAEEEEEEEKEEENGDDEDGEDEE